MKLNNVIYVAARQYKGEWIAAYSRNELMKKLNLIFPETTSCSVGSVYVTFD